MGKYYPCYIYGYIQCYVYGYILPLLHLWVHSMLHLWVHTMLHLWVHTMLHLWVHTTYATSMRRYMCTHTRQSRFVILKFPFLFRESEHERVNVSELLREKIEICVGPYLPTYKSSEEDPSPNNMATYLHTYIRARNDSTESPNLYPLFYK